MLSIPTFIIEKDIVSVIRIYSNRTNKRIFLLSSIFTVIAWLGTMFQPALRVTFKDMDNPYLG